jgi:hypothetical protein
MSLANTGSNAVAPPRSTANRSSVIAARTVFSRQTCESPAVTELNVNGPVLRSLSRGLRNAAEPARITHAAAVIP